MNKKASQIPEILFISDLHLTADRPAIIKLFSQFINQRAIHAQALYILGDFFEYWLGDDDPAVGLDDVFTAFETLNTHNVPVYFMHGNRDFLVHSDFEKRTHCKIIPDPSLLNINQTDVILMHGDSLCTDDISYQKFKKTVRTEQWKKDFTAKTISERKDIVKSLRATSKAETSLKNEDIMDVNQNAVDDVFKTQKLNWLIHGHTHRPDIHEYSNDDHAATRIVLGDWHDHGSVLSIKERQDTNGFDYELESFH